MLIKEFNKRFANGDQYIEISADQSKIIDVDKNYYWECRDVYNILKLIVDKYSSLLDEDLIYGKNGLVSLLIPYQKAYNNFKNKQQEYINRLNVGVIAVEDGSIDTDELIEEGLGPNKVLVYRKDYKKPEIEKSNTSSFSDFISLDKYYVNQMWEMAKTFVDNHFKFKGYNRKILKEAIEYIDSRVGNYLSPFKICLSYSPIIGINDFPQSNPLIEVASNKDIFTKLVEYYKDVANITLNENTKILTITNKED